MKTYGYDTIADALSGLIREKLCTVEKEALLLTQAALEKETCPAAAWALETIVENANIARENRFFACPCRPVFPKRKAGSRRNRLERTLD